MKQRGDFNGRNTKGNEKWRDPSRMPWPADHGRVKPSYGGCPLSEPLRRGVSLTHSNRGAYADSATGQNR